MIKKNKIGFIFCLTTLFGSNALHAQTQKDAKKVAVADTSKTEVTQQIEVVRAYKPVLADALKFRRNPNLNDIKPAPPKITYNLLDKRLELNTDIRELQIQKIIKPNTNELKNNYAKIGLGNLGTTLAQLNVATGQDQALQAGFNFNHLAQKGKLNLQNTSQQTATVYGKSIGNTLVMQGNLQYNRRTNYFYGIDEMQTFSNLNPQQQKINLFEANAELHKRTLSNDSNQLAFASKINAYHFNSIFDNTENNVTISADASKNIRLFKAGANAVIDFTSTKNSSNNLSNHLFKLNPYIQLDGYRFSLTAGLNYVNEFGTNQRIHIFPNANIDYALITDYLTLFASLNGDVNKTRLQQLTTVNPFLNTNPFIKNSIQKLAISGGVRGIILPNVGFKAMVKSISVTDFQYFINNIDEKQKFDIAYDDANILNFTGEINAKFSDNFSLDTKADFNQYTLSKQAYAWFNPALKFTSTAGVKIAKKFKLEADFYYQSLTKALVLNYPDPLAFSTPEYNPNTVATLPSFVDIGLGINYAYNNKFSAFIKANNLLNKQYQQFLYYPSFGLNVLGGISYSY